jgi:hypothetical protein
VLVQTFNDISNSRIVVATGGTITCCGDFKIHTFTGPGTFTVTCAGNPQGSSNSRLFSSSGWRQQEE